MKSHIIIGILFYSIAIIAQQPLKKVDSIFNSKLSENDPGLFLGIVKDGEVIFEGYKGMASLQHLVKIDKNSTSNIASTAKQFTALMVLDLAIKKQLSLEDDIRTYLPNLYVNVKESIKIRHLLNHTSGIRDFYDLMSIQQKPWWRREGLDNNDAISLLEKQDDLAFSPGSKYTYSNSGYTLLTKIIANVTKEDFHSYSKKFFEGLGMKNTHFLKNYMHVIPNQALPYSDWGDGVWQQYPMITNLYGDGFLFTTLKDQLIFETLVQNAKTHNNILLIESQKPVPNSEITSYGFGLELGTLLNYNAIYHSGGTGSYQAQTFRFPEEHLSIFVMSNNSRIWSWGIANEIARLLLPKKNVTINYDKRIENVVNNLNPDEIVATYLSPENDIIRIQKKEDLLTWKNGNNNPVDLIQEQNNIYAFAHNPKVKIGFFEHELVLFEPNGRTIEHKKIPNKPVTISDLQSYYGEYYSNELDVQFTISIKDDKPFMKINGWKNEHELDILNQDYLLVFNYLLNIERDPFDRVISILVSNNRASNNRFTKKTNLIHQPQIKAGEGTISVSTIGSSDYKSSQILLTKNDANGNEIWFKRFGGNSYDKASSILDTSDGYLIIGSTSSYGNGNYDMFVIKTDKQGKQLWQQTYGGFYNEYGYSAEATKTGYIIKGTKQYCENNTDINRKCTTNVWFVTIDKEGNEISNQVLEEIN